MLQGGVASTCSGPRAGQSGVASQSLSISLSLAATKTHEIEKDDPIGDEVLFFRKGILSLAKQRDFRGYWHQKTRHA